jgi:hypothetical protein
MYTWGPCDKGVYIKHLKLPGRGHSPSKADVSDIWNFVKQWTVDGKVGEASTTESSSSAPAASSSDVAKSSSSGATGPNSSGNVARSSSSGSHHHHGSSSSITNVTSSGAVSSSGAVGVLSSAGIIASIAQPADPSLLLVSVYKSSDNSIMVSNAQGKTITVFNSLGHVVRTTRGTADVQKVYTGAKGVYIVKVGTRTFKTSL